MVNQIILGKNKKSGGVCITHTFNDPREFLSAVISICASCGLVTPHEVMDTLREGMKNDIDPKCLGEWVLATLLYKKLEENKK